MKDIFKDYKDIVGVTELQQMLGCGRNTAYALIKNKKISAIRIGRTYRIPKTNIIDFISQNESV